MMRHLASVPAGALKCAGPSTRNNPSI